MKKRIISFSLWGSNPKYTHGAVRNALLAKYVYPGWQTIFYVADDVPKDIKDSILHNDGTIIEMGPVTSVAMLWRFYPLFDRSIDLFISRDTDSRLSYREKVMVNEFEESDFIIHSIRDHAYHNVPMLGGMWSAKPNKLPEQITESWFRVLIATDHDGPVEYDFDQKFLRESLLPEIISSGQRLLIHDYRFIDETNSYKFLPPPKRLNDDYVGAPYSHRNILEIPFVE